MLVSSNKENKTKIPTPFITHFFIPQMKGDALLLQADRQGEMLSHWIYQEIHHNPITASHLIEELTVALMSVSLEQMISMARESESQSCHCRF